MDVKWEFTWPCSGYFITDHYSAWSFASTISKIQLICRSKKYNIYVISECFSHYEAFQSLLVKVFKTGKNQSSMWQKVGQTTPYSTSIPNKKSLLRKFQGFKMYQIRQEVKDLLTYHLTLSLTWVRSCDELILIVKEVSASQQLDYKSKQKTSTKTTAETVSVQICWFFHKRLILGNIPTSRWGVTRNANVFPLTGLGLTLQFWSTAQVEW